MVKKLPEIPEMNALQYAEIAVSGKTQPGIVPGPLVKLACERHLRDLENQSEDTFWYDESGEDYVRRFIEQELPLVKGRYEGKPFKLLPWQSFVIGSLYGWYRYNEFGEVVRRFNFAYIETSKGSGKSPLSAALAIYSLMADGEPSPEIYVLARNVGQAKIPFDMIDSMIRNSPEINDRVRVLGGYDPNVVKYLKNNGKIVRLASDSRGHGKSGFMPSFVLADELHEHESAEMLERMSSGVKIRKNPLTFAITNSGAGSEGVAWEHRQYASDILLGIRENPKHFAFVAGMDKDDDPYENKECWPKSSVGLPWIPGYEYIQDEVRSSAGLPSKRSEVSRFQFCIWTHAIDPWIEEKYWTAAELKEKDERLPSKELLEKCPLFLAFDLAEKTDLTAGAAVWRLPDGTFYGEAMIWIPESKIETLNRKSPEPIYEWVRLEYINPVDKIQDFKQVASWVSFMQSKFNITAIAYDSRFINKLVEKLEENDIDCMKAPQCVVNKVPYGTIPMMSHPQGTQAPSQADDSLQLCMHTSVESFEKHLVKETFKAKYNPMLRSAVMGSVITKDQASNRRFLKRDAKVKIDASVAMTMAIGLADAWNYDEGGEGGFFDWDSLNESEPAGVVQ